jgi:hypothetical protein
VQRRVVVERRFPQIRRRGAASLPAQKGFQKIGGSQFKKWKI